MSQLHGVRRVSLRRADEIKKALKLKDAFSSMLDQMQ